MGYESKEAIDMSKNDEGEGEALLGRFKPKMPYPKQTEFKVFVGCLDDIVSRLEYENLLTKSYQCQNNLKKPGDLAMLTLQSTFDKEGRFHVVARYAILPEKEGK